MLREDLIIVNNTLLPFHLCISYSVGIVLPYNILVFCDRKTVHSFFRYMYKLMSYNMCAYGRTCVNVYMCVCAPVPLWEFPLVKGGIMVVTNQLP